jgi:ATP-dependent Clp protease adaptor protein ClpS
MANRFEEDEGVVTKTKSESEKKLKRPPLYRVLLHNDDYTTREFVVEILKVIFHKSEADAVAIMLHVHFNGVGVAGVYTREVAETKIRTVEHLARKHEYPFRLTMEPEGDGDDA